MEIFTPSIEILTLLFLVSIIAGLIDTLAGGGGLIALPALIMSGVPPLLALGTNKLQGSVGTATASIMMFKNKKVHWHDVKLLMLCAFLGSLLGTLIIQVIDTDALKIAIPIVLSFILLYFILLPRFSAKSNKLHLSKTRYQSTAIPIIGVYDGMFGPGTGSFFTLAGVSLRGHELVNATAIAKTLNFATNFSSLIIFIIMGKVVWSIGIVMMLGQALGAWIGSHLLFEINQQLLRFIVIIMCAGMLLKYVFF